MDSESSSKFIGSLTKFLQSLCNGYVEFEDGVELIGHIYLSVDTGKRGKKIDYILNEKVCKSDNSVTFISNSFHAQPEPKVKAASGKEGDSKNDGDTSDSEARSTNVGTIPHRASQASRSLPSPNQHRTSAQAGTKRPGSPLKAPTPPQRRAPTPPSQRRMQSSGAKGSAGSPASKNVPSSPSSSSQDNIPSPSSVRKRSETSQPPSNQSDTAGADNESDNLVPPNIVPINPTPDLASFLGSLTGDNQSSRDQRSPQTDTKPDTDVTFIKEEFVSEPSSCAQAGSSGQHPGRSGDDGSGLYPVMLHQNTSVFPSTSAGYPPGGFSGGASATATSQQPAFPGSSTSQSDLFNPVPGTSQDGADPSGHSASKQARRATPGHAVDSKGNSNTFCDYCLAGFSNSEELTQHCLLWHSDSPSPQPSTPNARGASRRKKPGKTLTRITKQVHESLDAVSDAGEALPVSFSVALVEEGGVSDDGKRPALGLAGVKELGRHTCPVCHKAFRYSFNLRRHLNTHTAYFQHKCYICGRGFHRSDFLQRHIRTVHKNIVTSAVPQF